MEIIKINTKEAWEEGVSAPEIVLRVMFPLP